MCQQGFFVSNAGAAGSIIASVTVNETLQL